MVKIISPWSFPVGKAQEKARLVAGWFLELHEDASTPLVLAAGGALLLWLGLCTDTLRSLFVLDRAMQNRSWCPSDNKGQNTSVAVSPPHLSYLFPFLFIDRVWP